MGKVHLIGNAHLDPVWLWRWQEGYAEVLATFRSALDRMNEYPDFIFTCAGAAYYQWVEKTDPEMFREIQSRVREGRWVIVGGWWIQPDCNAPCGESFARHALYSQRYFMNRFGMMAKVGYNVDSFGHNAMLPQILRLSGMDAYVFMRPNDREEKAYPFEENMFLWRSPDGSEVMAYRIGMGYNSDPFERCAEKAERELSLSNRFRAPMMTFYGVGNHGGGPTVQNLNALHDLMARSEPGEYAFSSPNRYFEELAEIRDQLPALEEDLQHHASGCYCAVMEIKRLNRKAEAELIAAEKYDALAKWLKLPGTDENFERAWQNVLFNQFHDILGGCSIRSACEDAKESYGESLSVAARATNDSLQAIAWRIDTSKGLPVRNNKTDLISWEQDGRGVPIVVFNPHSFPASAAVRTGLRISAVRDSDGAPVPTQRVRSEVTNGKEDKYENVFVAEVPAMGYRTYWLYKESMGEAARGRGMLASGEDFLENDALRVTVDRQSGRIASIFDKAAKAELLSAPAGSLVIDEADSDTWAHGIFSFRKEIGAFEGVEVKLVESGDVLATLRVRSRFQGSTIDQKLTLYRGLPGLYIEYLVDFRERHKMLKLSFPTVFKNGRVTASVPYGYVEREADGRDFPMQNFVAIGELGIATDSRAAYDALGGELRITALRTPIYADHFGERDDACEFTDQGEQRFTLVIMGVDNDKTALLRASALLGEKLSSIVGTYHEGTLPEVLEGIRIGADNVVASAIKQAEDGDGVIVRLYETQGRSVSAKVELPLIGLSFNADFSPFQIRSYRVATGRVTPVDLLEIALDNSPD